MNTKILKVNKKNVEITASHIINGGLVAFPTETVYGLGANALDENAVKKIFEVKGRPSDNPLIVHLSDIKKIQSIAYLNENAIKAIENFMPGALTIVLKKRENIASLVTAGLDTVAIRIPNNKHALKFLERADIPVAAPSANSSTKPSPTTANHVFEDLNGKIEYILDGGRCKIGIESTILDFSTDKIRLLRKGGISRENLERVLGNIEVLDFTTSAPLSPGMKYKHYSPKAEVLLFKNGERELIEKKYEELKSQGKKVIIIRNENPESYARNLFYEFRKADKNNVDIIICEACVDVGLGQSINNRLTKAGKYV